MIKNQITRSDAQRLVDMQNNVNAIILPSAGRWICWLAQNAIIILLECRGKYCHWCSLRIDNEFMITMNGHTWEWEREFKCVFMMEEIVAICDIKYCHFCIKYSWSISFPRCLTINVCAHGKRNLLQSPRCDSKCISRCLNLQLQRKEENSNRLFRGE